MKRDTIAALLSGAAVLLSSAAANKAQAGSAPSPVLASASPVPAAIWQHSSLFDAAMVAGTPQRAGAVLGVQCDVNDARGRRLVFGAIRQQDKAGLGTVLTQVRPATLRVAVESQSSNSEFVVDVEEHGDLLPQTPGAFAAAYLTSEQYGLIRSAKSVAVIVGNKDYVFTGTGSLAATNQLRCAGTAPIRASRMIAEKAAHPISPVKAPWTFLLKPGQQSGTGAIARASAAVLGFPESRLASFTFGVSCHASRLYAIFAGGAAAQSVAGQDKVSTAAFMKQVTDKTNFAEVYKNGRLVRAFSVEPGPDRKGHPLSSDDLAALLDFDALVVSTIGGGRSIEFGGKGSSESIAAVAEACGAKS